MQINPEILRNYWLRLSVHRLIIAPVVMAIILVLSFQTAQFSGGFEKYGTNIAPYAASATMATFIYLLIVFIWGGYSAAGAVLEQINDKTWDYQRLSSISPWSLSWGSVFGSTLFVWYCALVSLAFAIYYASVIIPFSSIINLLLVLLACGIFNIMLVSLVGLQALQTSDRSGKRRSIGYRLLGVIIGIIIWNLTQTYLLVPEFAANFQPALSPILNQANVSFYGNQIPGRSFALITVIVFTLWAFFGVYRTMRTELQMRSTPWGWTVFLLFLFFYFGNFSFQDDVFRKNGIEIFRFENPLGPGSIDIIHFLVMSLFISLISCYVMFFSDHLSITRYRMLQHRLGRKQFMRAAELIPRMSISYMFAIIFGIGLIILGTNPTSPPAFYTIAGLLLFCLRDIAILHFFSIATDNRRALMATLFYLAIFYILPLMIINTGNNLFSDTSSMFGFFYPPVGSSSIIDLIPITLQVLIAGFLIYRRWQSAYAPLQHPVQAAEQAA